MKKIVLFTGSMGRGGAERVISILSNYLSERGWDVTIIMLLHDITDGYSLDERVKIINFLPKSPISTPKKILRNIKLVRAYIKKEKPDVAVSFMAQNILISGIACRGLNIKFIASERIDPAKVKRNMAYKKVLENIYRKANKVIFQTKRAKEYFNTEIQKNSVIIGNPVSVSCLAEDNPKKKIVTAGRLTTQKNHKMLIEAFGQLAGKYSDYCLEIYGEGPCREELEKQIQEKGLHERVFLKGSSNKLHECICDSQIFVLSSDFEGLSNALIEAMMMGIPCISTDCAGSDEVIENGKNGLLVPVGNGQELRNAIEKLIEDADLRKKISENGKKRAEIFKTENIIEKWMDVIEG